VRREARNHYKARQGPATRARPIRRASVAVALGDKIERLVVLWGDR